MDAIMRESTSAQYIMKQSREEGIEQGIERGQRKSTLEGLIDVLEIRFGLSEAHPIADRIATIGRFATPEAVAPCGDPGVQPCGI